MVDLTSQQQYSNYRPKYEFLVPMVSAELCRYNNLCLCFTQFLRKYVGRSINNILIIDQSMYISIELLVPMVSAMV